MPTYEYACRACGHTFEEIQKISEPAIDECPKCGEKQAQRLISQGNFILKGSGWYTTGGYGSKSTKSDDGGASSSSAAASTKPAETKSETKSETKTETKSTDSGTSTSGSGSSGGSGPSGAAA